MRKFEYKGQGRIYCKEGHKKMVEQTIQQLDEYEFEYLPTDLVAPHTEYPKTVFVHKFNDMDLDALAQECWHRGIPIWVHIPAKELEGWCGR